MTAQVRTVTRVITESPALLAREREVFDRYARTLATAIANDTGADPGDVVCRMVANSLLGLRRALIDYVRSRRWPAPQPPGSARASAAKRSVRSRNSSAACATSAHAKRPHDVGDDAPKPVPQRPPRLAPCGAPEPLTLC